MSLSLPSSGPQVPQIVYAVIEIPALTSSVKYELDKVTGRLFVDRFLKTPMVYPCNYGFINNTLGLDGDPLDILILTPLQLLPGCVVPARPIGVLEMTDESGSDAKILAVPSESVCPSYSHIQSLGDVPELQKRQLVHFFEHYKALDVGKWVKIEGWSEKERAYEIIEESCDRALQETH